MIVHVLMRYEPYEGGTLLGAFSTDALAREAAEGIDAVPVGEGGATSAEWGVHEVIVDAPASLHTWMGLLG